MLGPIVPDLADRPTGCAALALFGLLLGSSRRIDAGQPATAATSDRHLERLSKARNSVMLCKTPLDFQPAHARTIPHAILGGEFLARGLGLEQARSIAAAYNNSHLPVTGQFRNEWAIVIADLKPAARPPINRLSHPKGV